MPLDPELRRRAEHNEAFLATIDIRTSPYLDWAVIIAFYVALRYVDAFFHPQRPVDHSERNRWVATNPRTRPIWTRYRELYNQAREARYEGVLFTPQNVEGLIRNQMTPIKAHLLRQ